MITMLHKSFLCNPWPPPLTSEGDELSQEVEFEAGALQSVGNCLTAALHQRLCTRAQRSLEYGVDSVMD